MALANPLLRTPFIFADATRSLSSAHIHVSDPAGSWNIITGYADISHSGTRHSRDRSLHVGDSRDAILDPVAGRSSCWRRRRRQRRGDHRRHLPSSATYLLRDRYVACSEAIRVVVLSWDKMTGGGMGISIPPSPHLASFTTRCRLRGRNRGHDLSDRALRFRAPTPGDP